MYHQSEIPSTSQLIGNVRSEPINSNDDVIEGSDSEQKSTFFNMNKSKQRKPKSISQSLCSSSQKRTRICSINENDSKKYRQILDDTLFSHTSEADNAFMELDESIDNIKGNNILVQEDALSVSQLNEFVINDSIGHIAEKKNRSSGDMEEFEFTQYCNNSQFMNQIENAISKIQYVHKTQPKLIKTPLKSSLFVSQLNNADVTLNQALCDLFQTSQFRHELHQDFDTVEKTICHAANKENEFNSLITSSPQKKVEDLLDKTFKNPEVMKKVLKHAEESVNLNKDQIDLSSDMLSDIGNIFKSAFLENVNKTLIEETQLTKVDHSNVIFYNHGDFFGLPDRVKDLIKVYKGIDQLYDWQIECLKLPAIEQRKNLIYALPTSGGKTLVAEILMLREILCRRKNAVFILPYVAIVQEKVWAMSPFAVALEFLVEEYAAGKGTFPPRKRRRKNSVYICTIEKALGLINSLIEADRTDEVGLVVVDELHLLGDGHRGACLESLLTKIKVLKSQIQIIGMSATIGNVNEICTFLNADIYSNDFRPVDLVEYIKVQSEIARVNTSATDPEDILVYEKRTNYYKNAPQLEKIDPDHLGGLVSDVIPESSCLIFCKTRQNCENVANLLCKVLNPELKKHRETEKNQIKRALQEEIGSLCRILKRTIDFGIAYHHSGLTAEERRVIEDGFRLGVITVICCTSTLAAGVNLPAKRVIIRNPYIGREFINLSRYKQMIGRAGRAGFGEVGESILISTPQELPRIKDLLLSPMDTALSSLHENDAEGLQNFQLSCISLGLANTKEQLQKLTYQTLMAVQCERIGVDIRKQTRGAIKTLFKCGALQTEDMKAKRTTDHNVTAKLESTLPISSGSIPDPSQVSQGTKKKVVLNIENDTVFSVTDLGRAAMKGGLDLNHAHILYEDLIKAQKSLVLFTGLHLMYLVTPYSISEQVHPSKTLYYNLYTKLDEREVQTAKVLGFSDAVAGKLLTNRKISEPTERVMNRFFVTLMLYDLWNEMSVFQVSRKYDVNRGLIQNLMTSAATFSSNVYHFCGEFEEFWAFSLLLKGMSDRLSHCCVKELIPLMKLPAVKQNRAKQLFNAGFKTLQSIARATPEQLMHQIEFMSRKLANQLIAASKLILLEKVENLREEAEEVLDGINLLPN